MLNFLGKLCLLLVCGFGLVVLAGSMTPTLRITPAVQEMALYHLEHGDADGAAIAVLKAQNGRQVTVDDYRYTMEGNSIVVSTISSEENTRFDVHHDVIVGDEAKKVCFKPLNVAINQEILSTLR